MSLDPERLDRGLSETFGGTDGSRRAVVRSAVDLADSRQYERDVGATVTTTVILEELADAPDGGPADRWNWWIGSLDLAFGGYERFGVRRYRR